MAAKYNISVGRSRQETRWHNESWTWEEIVDRLSETKRTPETVKEYNSSTKDRQGEIKDVGGFVGGHVIGGRRKKGAVTKRSLLTLDIDYGTPYVWEDITSMFNCAVCMYSTHSHSESKNRFRLIMPLDREVDVEEYEAIARRVAGNIGIDLFDDSTYQVERLMYWPSTSADGVYVFESQEGEPLSTKEVLDSYLDWKDSSQWPISSRVSEVLVHEMRKLGDPTTKGGFIGKFCQAYTMHEAIDKYLGEVYEQTDTDPNRYTFISGSTAGGMIVYDDKFAYSHHGTDPACGICCNAFDLVRIHLFGNLDEGKRKDCPVGKLPSFLEMERLASEDVNVLKIDNKERRKKLEEEFEGFSETEDSDGWMNLLERDKHNRPLSTVKNIMTILENAKGLKGNIRRNDLIRADVIKENLPWRKYKDGANDDKWGNDDYAGLFVYLGKVFGIDGKEKMMMAQTAVSAKNRFHPVRDYIRGLHWDGVKRIDRLFIDYLGAHDDELTKSMTRKSLIAAVTRAFNPGCKFDNITVLQGAEGIGKSTLLSKLGGDWFSDSVVNMDGKEGMEQIQGGWIIEIGELNGIKRSEVEGVKAFLSRTMDVFRPAYGRTKEFMPRQCVFFATTNETSFLKGDSGNRRFWIVQCDNEPNKDVWKLSSEDRDQIWAEAYHYYNKGEELFLSDDFEKLARIRQKEMNETATDPRKGIIEEFLNAKIPADWYEKTESEKKACLNFGGEFEESIIRTKVCAIEILKECFHDTVDGNSKYKIKEINALMKDVKGWKRSVVRIQGYGLQRGFVRTEFDGDEDL